MWKREGVRPLRAAVIVLAASAWALTAVGAQFTADMVETRGKTTKTSRLSVMGHRYAIQFEEQGQRGKVTVDQAKNVTRIFMPSEKKFIKMRSDSMQSLMNDPIQAFREASKRYAVAKEGTETVAGYVCEKLVLSGQGQKLMTEWVARDLGFPVKIVTHGKEPWTMELKNIKRGGVSPGLFKVPPGYTKVDKMKAGGKKDASLKKDAAPATGLTSAVKGTAPFGRRLGPGGEMRVALAGNRPAKVYVKNLQGEKTVTSVVPFRNGKKVESIGVSPTRLKERYEVWYREFNSPSKLKMSAAFRVDEVVITNTQGQVVAWVEQGGRDASDKFNPGGTTTWVGVRPDKPLSIRITGADQAGGPSKVRMRVKAKGGTKLADESFSVGNGETRDWRYPASSRASDVQVTVKKGEGMVGISLDQTGAAGVSSARPPKSPVKTRSIRPLGKPPERAARSGGMASTRSDGMASTRPGGIASARPGGIASARPGGRGINVLAAKQGTRVVAFTSEYSSSWKADNLIDGRVGTQHQYASRHAEPQEIVFELPRTATVSAVVVNPYTTESSKTWVRDCELWLSSEGSGRGFAKVMDFEVQERKGDQRFTFPPADARWVKLVMKSNRGGGYIEAGEVKLVGYFGGGSPR